MLQSGSYDFHDVGPMSQSCLRYLTACTRDNMARMTAYLSSMLFSIN